MTGKGDDTDDSKSAVGYGRPPRHTRFRKGVSGNPAGRPRGARNKAKEPDPNDLRDIFLREAARQIPGQDGSNTQLTIYEAAIRRTLVDAAKGRPRAQDLVLKYGAAIERAMEAERDEAFREAVVYKMWAEREIARREQLGITDAMPIIPHPDNIEIDVRTREVRITGPLSPDEHRAFEYLKRRAGELRLAIEGALEKLASARNPERRHLLQSFIVKLGKDLRRIEQSMP